MKINKTQLDISKAEEREIVHRDYIAHCLRWSNILKNAEIGETILDIGCADAPLAMTFYSNKYKPAMYVGVDIRESMIEKNKLKVFNFPTEFISANIITQFDMIPKKDYTIISMLEVLEHFEGEYVPMVLDKIIDLMSSKTTLYISTPCFNGEKANNHVKEWTYEELYLLLHDKFIIQSVNGTFASQRDIKPYLNEHETWLLDNLKTYYDSNLISVLLAPLHPEHSRNCLWSLKKKV